jgi:hypothetical protein
MARSAPRSYAKSARSLPRSKQTCRSLSQGDVELMTEKEDLGIKLTSRLEQVGAKHCKQAEDHNHRIQ